MNGTIIGKLVEAFYEQDEEKFTSFAQLIADGLKEEGKEMSAKIIEKRLKNKGKMDGEPTCCLDGEGKKHSNRDNFYICDPEKMLHCESCGGSFYIWEATNTETYTEYKETPSKAGDNYEKYLVNTAICPFCCNPVETERKLIDREWKPYES